MEKQSDLLTAMFSMSQMGRKYTTCTQLMLWKDGRIKVTERNLSGLFTNIRKPWAAAKCFCLPISTMFPPAGVTRKQEESVMPSPMISCLRSSNALTIPVCLANDGIVNRKLTGLRTSHGQSFGDILFPFFCQRSLSTNPATDLAVDVNSLFSLCG